MLQIEGAEIVKKTNFGIPVFRLGFRPFFLAAGLFAVISMALWMASYVFGSDISFSYFSPVVWHSHEMVFGYTMAVVAGFLLTAIRNWTGVDVLRGNALAGLFLLWLVARVLPFPDLNIPLWVAAVIDVSFLFFLTLVCLRPVLKVRQYKQMGIIAKLILMMVCHIVFYLGLAGEIEQGVKWGIESALYMIIALILVMMRRVMPMFISNGVDIVVEMKNRAWLDISSIALLVCLWISDVFYGLNSVTGVVALSLVALHGIRLAGWYTNAIWVKPLVWILVVAYLGLIFGFLLKALSVFTDLSPLLSLHAFTVGGIGLITLGMMSRVSLGHTGRDVFNPPPVLFWCFLLLVLSFLARVVLPVFSMEFYSYWIGLSQLLWITAFGVFVMLFAPILLSQRVDGRDG